MPPPASLRAIRQVLSVHGIAHRVQFRLAGVRMRDLRDLVDGGALRQVRRDWFAAESCSPLLVRAVHSGTTLACVSAAAALGLWDTESPDVHVSAARNTPRIHREPLGSIPGGMAPLHVHWTRSPSPQSAPRVRAPIEPIERVLTEVARCRPLEEAVAIVDSALRRDHITMHELRMLADTCRELRTVVEFSHPLADSGWESITRVRLAKRGVTMVPQAMIDGHPVDGLIGSRLVLQIDGYGPHSGRRRRRRDLAQDERLRRRGFIVLRYSVDHVRDEWPMIESSVLSIVASGRHL